MKKLIFLLVLFIICQNFVYAEVLKCNKKGTITTCTLTGTKIVEMQDLQNGFVSVQNYYMGAGSMGDLFSENKIMTKLQAQNYLNTLNFTFSQLEQSAKEEQKKKKIIETNKQIYTKRVSITTSSGDVVSFEEDKNGDDFLVYNSKRTKIGRHIASEHKQQTCGYNPWDGATSMYPELEERNQNIDIKQIFIQAKKDDQLHNKDRNAAQIICDKYGFGTLFKEVYKLRYYNNVSYEDAQKLMTFGYNNGNYKPEHLILPSEMGEMVYNQNLKSSTEKMNKLIFPKK